jgi:hypothetical protein
VKEEEDVTVKEEEDEKEEDAVFGVKDEEVEMTVTSKASNGELSRKMVLRNRALTNSSTVLNTEAQTLQLLNLYSVLKGKYAIATSIFGLLNYLFIAIDS